MMALDRKLLRDLWRTRAQVASIALVLAGGVLSVVSIRGTASSLVRARDEYYAAGHFADVFATLTRAPDAVRARLEALPGVAQVQTRVVKDVRLDIPGFDRPGTGRLISMPPSHAGPQRINCVRVVRGRMFASDADDEVLINGRFAEVNHLAPGDTLTAIINERRTRLRIVGIGAAPDYLYEEAGGGPAVDERAFGILWAPHALVTEATGMRGAFNDVGMELAPGARLPAVLAGVDSVLARYGGRGAIGRRDQLSHRIVENELSQLLVMGWAFPVFFVGVAAFLTGTVLSRLIATEREQVAILKAFGYTNGSVARHYLAYATLAFLFGIAIGVLIGEWFGRSITTLYSDILRIPDLRFRIDWPAMLLALAALSVASLLGAVRSVLGAARLPPAEALRPPTPARYRMLLLDRLGVGGILPASARMVLRGLERRPSRALLGATGIAAALAMMVGTLSLYDASSRMIEVMFRIGHRETLGVSLVSPVPVTMASRFRALPGVTTAEMTRAVPARIHHAGRSRTLALTGLERDAEIYRLVDVRGAAQPVPPDGVTISAALARTLGVRVGDTVRIELLEQLKTRRVVVTAAIDEMTSPNAYMEIGALGRLTGEGAQANAVYLRLAGRETPELLAGLREMARVGSVASRSAMLEAYDRMMARSFRINTTVIVIFATVIAIGVVYNGARIALSERGRELASLRVLGFTTREVGTLLLGEQGVVALLALPIGWLLGWLFGGYLVHAFESEHYQVPFVSRSGTYVFASMVVLLASAIAGALMYRRAARLDLVAVLKTRE
ncbi:MAG TPA: FtsX-like permease family protein [Gemmatimonadaceae bacterium]|nr:FtsX-like permease family protein [Gemmatimonadaceae bacterium]